MNREPGCLHHVEFYVNDIKQSSIFWSWFLSRYGYHLSNEWETGQSWRLSNGTYLVFVQVEKQWLDIKNNRQGQGFNHMAFWSFPSEDLQKLSKEVEEHGAKVLLQDEKHVCFEYQDGLVAEVYLQ